MIQNLSLSWQIIETDLRKVSFQKSRVVFCVHDIDHATLITATIPRVENHTAVTLGYAQIRTTGLLIILRKSQGEE